MICCICEEEIEPVRGWEMGNNAEPVVKDGRCCDTCNTLIVVPVRMKRIEAALWQKPTKEDDDRD